MKLIHLSDLHIGKRLNDVSFLEDQAHIFEEVVNVAKEKNVEGIIIAGDVYDKVVPSAEAVELYDQFITSIKDAGIKVFIISGNHDSAERIACLESCMDDAGVYISPVYNKNIKKVELEDEYGKLNVYLLPYIKPANVRNCHEEEKEMIESYEDAMKTALSDITLNKSERNVLVSHQFITGATLGGSEVSVGGLDEISKDLLKDFDYVALGHIHKPQSIEKDKIRYCGTLLKYAFSEVDDEKRLYILDFKEKGTIETEKVELHPLHEMYVLEGEYNDLMGQKFYEGEGKKYTNAYLKIVLTNKDEIANAGMKLRNVYPFLLQLDYKSRRTSSDIDTSLSLDVDNKSPLELFADFFKSQTGDEMSQEQTELVKKLMEEINNSEEVSE